MSQVDSLLGDPAHAIIHLFPQTDDLGQAFGLLWAGAGDDTDGHHLSPPQSLLSLSSDDEPQQQSLELGQQQQQSQRGDTAAKENSPPKTDSEAEANNGRLFLIRQTLFQCFLFV